MKKLKNLRVIIQKSEPAWLNESGVVSFSSCLSLDHYTDGCKAFSNSPQDNGNNTDNVQIESDIMKAKFL